MGTVTTSSSPCVVRPFRPAGVRQSAIRLSRTSSGKISIRRTAPTAASIPSPFLESRGPTAPLTISWIDSAVIRIIAVNDDDGLAIEIRITEELSRLLEIHDREEELVVVLIDAGPTPDDLFEHGHRVDGAIQHDELAGLRIDAGRQKLGGSCDDRIRLFRVNKIVELSLPFVIVPRNTHDVSRVIPGEGPGRVDDRLPHPFGVVDILTEDDRLGHWIGGLEMGHHPFGHQLGALVEDQDPIHVHLVVFPLLNRVAQIIKCPRWRRPTINVAIDIYADDFVGCQEPVFDALFEAVSVNGIAEIGDVGDISGLLGRRGHTDVNGAVEIVENLPPCAVVGGAASMAFVDYNQVEEVLTS